MSKKILFFWVMILFVVISANIVQSAFSVQNGNVTVNGETNVTISSINISKSFVIISSRSTSSSPQSLLVTAILTNSTNLLLRNYVNTVANVEYEVVTGTEDELSSQSNNFSYGSGTGTNDYNITINQVNLSSSFIIVSARVDAAATGSMEQGGWKAKFNNATQINIQRIGTKANGGDLVWQVIDWTGSRIINGSVSITGGSSSVLSTFPSLVNVSKSFMIFSSSSDVSTLAGSLAMGKYNSTTATFSRKGTTSKISLEYFIVEDNSILTQTGFTYVATTAQVNQTISVVNVSKSFILSSSDSTGGVSTWTNTFFTSKLFNSTLLYFQKGAALQSQNISWYVVELQNNASIVFPNVSLVYPVNITYNVDVSTLNYTSSTCSRAWYSTNLGVTNSTSVACGTNFTGITSSEGSNTWIVYVNDTSGNINLSSITFYKDTKSPQYNVPTYSAVINLSNSQIVRINVSDVTSEIKSVLLEVDSNVNYTMNLESSNTYNYIWTPLVLGNVSFRIFMNDSAGNYNLTSQYSFTVNNNTASTNTLEPLLEVNITEYDASPITGTTGVKYKARIRNVGTSSATNLTINWTLPSGWTITSGSGSEIILSLGINQTIWSNLTVTIGSTPGTDYAVIEINCFESSYAMGNKTLTISSPASVPSSSSEISNLNSSGGSGKSTLINSLTNSIAFTNGLELVRNKEQEFVINITNKYATLELHDLEIKITGFPSSYFSVKPSIIPLIKSKDSAFVTIFLDTPPFGEYESSEFSVFIKGNLVGLNGFSRIYTENRTIRLTVQEISRLEVEENLKNAIEAIAEMNSSGFNIKNVQKLLENARKKLYYEKINKEAQDLINQIISSNQKSFRVNELINNLLTFLANPTQISLLTGNVVGPLELTNNDVALIQTELNGSSPKELVDLASAAFEREDYDVAEQKATIAQLLLLFQYRDNFKIFLSNYWYLVFIFLVGFGFFITIGYRLYLVRNISKKIKQLNKQETEIESLIISSQLRYLNKKIGKEDYEILLHQYKTSIEETKRNRISLRSKRIKLLKATEIHNELENEEKEIEKDNKTLRIRLYNLRNISKEDYELQLGMLNERLAEIEDERTTLALTEKQRKLEKKLKGKWIKLKHKHEVKHE